MFEYGTKSTQYSVHIIPLPPSSCCFDKQCIQIQKEGWEETSPKQKRNSNCRSHQHNTHPTTTTQENNYTTTTCARCMCVLSTHTYVYASQKSACRLCTCIFLCTTQHMCITVSAIGRLVYLELGREFSAISSMQCAALCRCFQTSPHIYSAIYKHIHHSIENRVHKRSKNLYTECNILLERASYNKKKTATGWVLYGTNCVRRDQTVRLNQSQSVG